MHIWQKSFTPTFSHKKAAWLVTLSLAGLFVLTFVLSLLFGSAKISITGAMTALFRGDMQNTDLRILLYIRLPRVLGAILSGSALAVSGVLTQAVLQNPMAAPSVIGVNAGAGLSACLLMALLPAAVSLVPCAAFCGALLSCLLIWAVARMTGAGRLTITLVGVTVSSILSAGINAVKTFFPDSLYNTNTFLVGGLSGVGLDRIAPAAPLIAAGLFLACLFSRQADVLALGDETAASLGMGVRRAKFLLLSLAAVLAGAAVSFAGLLGFVGLLTPHILRRFVGGRHRWLLPLSALGGTELVLLCDLLGRVLFAPYELPVGILLSLIGGPFFLLLILTKRRMRYA